MRILTLLLFVSACVISCASRPNGSSEPMTDSRDGKNSITKEEVPAATNLTDYLQRISGVLVNGQGPRAQIRIRGPVSFQGGSNQPLFVVNGSQFGYDYARVYNTIDVRDIARVKVLKGADETAVYGSQGAAGVIEITLRD